MDRPRAARASTALEVRAAAAPAVSPRADTARAPRLRLRATTLTALAAVLACAVAAAPAQATKRGHTAGARFTLRGEVLTVTVNSRTAARLASKPVSVSCGPTLADPLSTLVRQWNPRRHADRFVAIFPLPVERGSRTCGIGDPASSRWFLRAAVR
jgi:hypothetical protein